ncbi:MAG: hypothetical protein HXS51_13900 [Theionarchaea archaeon]|nr:hypothetical protein [Theionarchaea archaeon]
MTMGHRRDGIVSSVRKEESADVPDMNDIPHPSNTLVETEKCQFSSGISERRDSVEIQDIQRLSDRHEHDGKESHIICPVCGGRISEQHLPNKESVIDDGIFYMIESDRIISSRMTIGHRFDHFYNEEEDCIRNDPHALVSIIEAEFDGAGRCTLFSVLGVYAASPGGTPPLSDHTQ